MPTDLGAYRTWPRVLFKLFFPSLRYSKSSVGWDELVVLSFMFFWENTSLWESATQPRPTTYVPGSNHNSMWSSLRSGIEHNGLIGEPLSNLTLRSSVPHLCVPASAGSGLIWPLHQWTHVTAPTSSHANWSVLQPIPALPASRLAPTCSARCCDLVGVIIPLPGPPSATVFVCASGCVLWPSWRD